MPKMIQIRHVPDHLHARLKARAAMEGKSLSDYLLGELQQLSHQPTLEEWLARVQARKHTRPRTSSAAMIRQLRGKI